MHRLLRQPPQKLRWAQASRQPRRVELLPVPGQEQKLPGAGESHVRHMAFFDRIAVLGAPQRLVGWQDALIEPDHEHRRPFQTFGGVDGRDCHPLTG
jgi:hypothetical protein